MLYSPLLDELLSLIPTPTDVSVNGLDFVGTYRKAKPVVSSIFIEDQERLDKIASLVSEYRNGSTKAVERLLELFEPYISSWANFLKGTPRKGSTYELFLRDPRFRPIPGDLRSKHLLISKSLNTFTFDDLRGEVVLAFLQACLYSENITSGVAYYLAASIYEIIRDPANFAGRCFTIIDALDDKSDVHERLSDSSSIDLGNGDDFVYSKEIRTAKVEVGDCGFTDLVRVFQRTDGLIGAALSEDWIQGLTVGLGGGEVFELLTPQEREILLRFYVAHQKHAEIAPSMNISHRHSRTLLARARKKLGINQESKVDSE